MQICCDSGKIPSEKCDFSKHIRNLPEDQGNYLSDGTPCGDLVFFFIRKKNFLFEILKFFFQIYNFTIDWIFRTVIDTYNIYQDCYGNDQKMEFFQNAKKFPEQKIRKNFLKISKKFFKSSKKFEGDTAVKMIVLKFSSVFTSYV